MSSHTYRVTYYEIETKDDPSRLSFVEATDVQDAAIEYRKRDTGYYYTDNEMVVFVYDGEQWWVVRTDRDFDPVYSVGPAERWDDE